MSKNASKRIHDVSLRYQQKCGGGDKKKHG